MIELKNIVQEYQDRRVIDGLSLTIDTPGIYVLMGQPNSGKTTLLRIIAGMVPTSGEVIPNGEAVIVPQYYTNRPNISVAENVAGNMWVLEQVGLADVADSLSPQLSVGQNQRLALARALVTKPEILLMDESFGSFDAQIRRELQELLIDLQRETKSIIVFVTHNIEEALLLGNRIIVLSNKNIALNLDKPFDRNKVRSHLMTE